MADNIFKIGENFTSIKSLLKSEKDRRCEAVCNEDEKLENDLWLFLYNFGFTSLNIGRQCEVEYGSKIKPDKKKVDIIAEDEHVRLFIECTIQKVNSSKIKQWINEKAEIAKYASMKDKNTVFIYFTNQNVNLVDYNKLRNAGIVLLKHSSLEYLNKLKGQYKKLAYYHFLNYLLKDKPIKKGVGFLEIPAIKCKYSSSAYCYLFGIQPIKLIPLANVMHRTKWLDPDQEKASNFNNYQRLVKKSKIKKIKKFIEKERGVFPTNIIVSFKKVKGKQIFTPKGKIEDISYGILKLPMTYQSVTIIDGQHRLFAYDELEAAKKDLIYVIGFEEMGLDAQMKTFIDINKNQTKVSSSLLWDLYPDLLDDSRDDYKLLKTISNLAKGFCRKEAGNALFNHIEYDSDSAYVVEPKITLESFCTAIKNNNIIGKIHDTLSLLGIKKDDIDQYYIKILRQYFDVIRELNTTLWDKRTKTENIFCSNQGIGALIILFVPIFEYLYKKGSLKKAKDAKFINLKNEFRPLVKPIVDFVDSLKTADDIKNFKSKGESGKREMYKRFLKEINNVHNDFGNEELKKEEVVEEKEEEQELIDLMSELKKNDEGQELEAKEAFFINTKKSRATGKLIKNTDDEINGILKTVVAFANNPRGGEIILGLKDKTWEVAGLDTTDIIEKRDVETLKSAISNIIRSHIDGLVKQPKLKKHLVDGKTIIVIKVFPLLKKNFEEYKLASLKEKGYTYVYIREGSDTIYKKGSEVPDYCLQCIKDIKEENLET